MKKNLKIILLTLLVVCSLVNCPVFAEERESRLLWVTRWDYKTKEDIQKIMENAASLNFNIIIFQIRGNATAFYKSPYEPWAEQFDFTDPGYDPLEVACEEAHKLGLELHAYTNVFPAWKSAQPPKSPEQVLNKHPEWIMVDNKGKRMVAGEEYINLSPGIPEVQDYLYNIFIDIVKRYNVDGLHLDYVRFPWNTYSYDSASVARFIQTYGVKPWDAQDKWSDWRREQITSLVRRTYYGIKMIKPKVKLSAATWATYESGRNNFLQEAREWLREGVVDFVCPMTYAKDMPKFQQWMKDHLSYASFGKEVYPAVGVYQLDSVDMMLEQIKSIRESGGRGISIFAYASLFPSADKINSFNKMGDKISTMAEALVKGPFVTKVKPYEPQPITLANVTLTQEESIPPAAPVVTLPATTAAEVATKKSASGEEMVNIALTTNDTKATASSELASDHPSAPAPASDLIDGDMESISSRWVTKIGDIEPYWVMLDFGKKQTFTEIKLFFDYKNKQIVKDYTLQYADGENWKNIDTVTENTEGIRTHTFAAVTSDKVRLTITRAWTDSMVRMFEFQVWGKGNKSATATTTITSTPIPATTLATTTNVALASNGAKASASSEILADHPAAPAPASKLIDGDTESVTSRWVTKPDDVEPYWMIVDFGKKRTFGEIKIFFDHKYKQVVKDYALQYWSGESWINIEIVSGNTEEIRTHTFTPVSADKVRLQIFQAWTDHLVRMFEFQVWGK